MSNKKIKELKNLSKDELNLKVRTIQADLFKARIQKQTGQLEDVNTLWRMRKEIARIKTLQTQLSTAGAKK